MGWSESRKGEEMRRRTGICKELHVSVVLKDIGTGNQQRMQDKGSQMQK